MASGLVELRDLVALGQVGVEVIFAVKERQRAGSRRAWLPPAAPPFSTTALFNTGSTPGSPQHTGQILVLGGSIPRIRLAGAEDLGGGVELDVGFQPDDGFVFGHI